MLSQMLRRRGAFSFKTWGMRAHTRTGTHDMCLMPQQVQFSHRGNPSYRCILPPSAYNIIHSHACTPRTPRRHGAVDLAGSERPSKTGSGGGVRFEEMTKINLSLTTLARVIDALVGPSHPTPQHH